MGPIEQLLDLPSRGKALLADDAGKSKSFEKRSNDNYLVPVNTRMWLSD